MRLPRNLSGKEFAKSLQALGYRATRQTGSHLRLTTQEKGEHHLTVPLHSNLRVGMLAGILSDIAQHFQLSREELLQKLFKK